MLCPSVRNDREVCRRFSISIYSVLRDGCLEDAFFGGGGTALAPASSSNMEVTVALEQKHLVAIESIISGDTPEEASVKSKIPISTLYALIEGNRKPEFSHELQRRRLKREEKIRDLSLDSKRGALKVVKAWIDKHDDKHDDATTKKCLSILNSLGKATPNVNIGINITMTSEERKNEFNRLKGLAADVLDGTGISSIRRN